MLLKMSVRQTFTKQMTRRKKEKGKSSWKYTQLVSGDLLKRSPMKALPLFGLKTGLQNITVGAREMLTFRL